MSDEPTRQQVLRSLQDLHDKALEAEAFAPALKALEMIGREIGMWRDEAKGETPLEDLIAGRPRVRDDDGP